MNLFIDLGTHMGGGLLKFITQYNMKEEDWEIHTFEPQPKLFELGNKNSKETYIGFPYNFSSMNKAMELFPSVNRHNAAASDQDGTANFYIEQQIEEMHMGSTIMTDRVIKMPNYYDLNNLVSIKTIDIYSFIQNILKLKNINQLVIKIDIEGAEFLVLNKFIKELDNGNNLKANKIEIYCEFHHRLLPNDDFKYPSVEYYFKKLKNYNINLYNWD